MNEWGIFRINSNWLYSTMGRKGKTQKHTAKEIAGKTKAARERNGAAGFGGQGKAARLAVMQAKDVICNGE